MICSVVARIAVFDSGLGSLSIISEMQKSFKSEIIYFADQQSYPYGKKSQAQLRRIIAKSLSLLEGFAPDYIVVASNTPSLILDLAGPRIFDVKPPLAEARKLSRSGKIGILATESAVRSRGFSRYVQENVPESFRVFRINGSVLVDLVESGRFLTDKKYCEKVIRSELRVLDENDIDVVTLSSTHLPFLRRYLEREFSGVRFIDPGRIVAQRIYSKIKDGQPVRNSLKIFASGDIEDFQAKLSRIGIRNKVSSLSF